MDEYEQHVLNEGNRRMRRASGQVDDDRDLVAFFYLLGRDVMSLGAVEEMVLKLEVSGEERGKHLFTNGWLARWAQDLAGRLMKE